MTKIFLKPAHALFSGGLARSSPAYVQYYVTARCNLRCEQCNVIYANADQSELSTSGALKVLDSLAEIGTSVVLFTGGEPFMRNDLGRLVKHAIELGIHPRLQTNGVASLKQLEDVAAAGANDISISLDSLEPNTQDEINGGFENSWESAIDAVSNISQVFPPETFAAFGCVLAPRNIRHIPSVIEFASEIGWWVSLVPAHSTPPSEPRAFSTFSRELEFSGAKSLEAVSVLDTVRKMKRSGQNVYDSNQYLDDIERYIQKVPTTWRSRNSGQCDAGTSYFAVTPNGDMAACCDYRLPEKVSLTSDDFGEIFRTGKASRLASEVATACSGCMYGSYPEITISTRFAHAAGERFLSLFASKRSPMRKMNPNELHAVADEIRQKNG